MKKTIIILIILCFSGILKAQNNLEFSKVIKLSGNIPNNGQFSFIVPNNKVWKITSGTVAFTSSTALIDDHLVYTSCSTCFPLWLSEGDHIIKTSQGGFTWSISGIEFSIVP